ncbi:MAG TPA: anaerobic glycerol-3-phosphate dehydrogenase subunit GlpB [Candidatus Limnocylindrales bacterium]|nr:anaerobic glycerol-3-phosphate dehydrogenase subunit GlpB [Candidatus Limnocylindrales bacterium]
MSSADVVVVGAGLAGLTAAIRLAEAGASVDVVARGHAATHWTAGGIDVAAPRGAETPAQGLKRLRSVPGHPYAVVGDDVPAALEWFRPTVAASGLEYIGDLSSPIRHVPTSIGATRPASIVPAAQAGALRPWSPDERLVICGFGGFKDFWADEIAASLSRADVWGSAAGSEGVRPSRVESVTVALPGTQGRHNLSALDIARLFDDPGTRKDAIAALASALNRAGARPGRVGLPAALGLDDHRAVITDVAAALDLDPFEIPLVPPSIPGLRLFGALRSALRAAGGRITVGEPVLSVERSDRRVTAISTSAAARQRTIRANAVVLATGGIAGGGLIGTAAGLVEPVLGLPAEAPPVNAWLSRTPFDPAGHPLELAGIRTDADLRPVFASGETVFENVVAAGSILAGQRYLAERCGDGVAIASGYRAAATLLGGSKASGERPRGKRREAAAGARA